MKFTHFDARTGLSVDCRPAEKPPCYEPCDQCAFVAISPTEEAAIEALEHHHVAAHRLGRCLPTVEFSGTVAATT